MWECEFWRIYIYIGYTLPTIGEYVSAEYAYLYWISANNWGIFDSWICIFVLDMICQQLGYIWQLKGVCAPFGRGIGEFEFWRIYIYIGYFFILYTANNWGICVNWIYIFVLDVGYILPTIVGYMIVGGCLCALRVKLSVFTRFTQSIKLSWWKIVHKHGRCRIVRSVKLTPKSPAKMVRVWKPPYKM